VLVCCFSVGYTKKHLHKIKILLYSFQSALFKVNPFMTRLAYNLFSMTHWPTCFALNVVRADGQGLSQESKTPVMAAPRSGDYEETRDVIK
jgi:hypothetical protein